MDHIERYLIEPGPTGLTIKMRQQGRALAVGGLALAILIASWGFSPHGPLPAALWAPPAEFLLIWCSFFGLVSLGCIIGFFYRQDATITRQEMIHSRAIGPWRKEFHRPRPRKLQINVQSGGTSTGAPIFRYQLLFLDEEGRVSEFCVELQSAASVDRFIRAMQPLKLEVEDPNEYPSRA